MCIKKRNSLKKVEWQLTGVCVCVCVFGGADSPHISSVPVSAPLDCLLSLLFFEFCDDERAFCFTSVMRPARFSLYSLLLLSFFFSYTVFNYTNDTALSKNRRLQVEEEEERKKKKKKKVRRIQHA